MIPFSQSSRMPDRRRLIQISILGLMLLVLGLSSLLVYQAYRDYRTAQLMVRVNTLSDRLIRAAQAAALERGIISAALGVAQPIDRGTEARITAARLSVETAWRAAEASTLELINRDIIPDRTPEAARAAHLELSAARESVDHCLTAPGTCGLEPEEWLHAVRQFIEATHRLREEIFVSLLKPNEIIQTNLTMKRWAAVASENAGRERGVLAYYIGAGKPLPAPVLRTLQTYRGVVNRTVREIKAFSQRPDTDPRIVASVERMESEFADRFGALRIQVYAGAAYGSYPLDVTEWLEASSWAIDSILRISSTLSKVSEERAEAGKWEQQQMMALQGGLALIAIAFAGLGTTRVRQIANELFQQKELAEITLHSIGDAVISTDAEGLVTYLNPVAEELTGWQMEVARGRHIGEIFRIVNGLSREPEPNPVEQCLKERRVVGLVGNVVLLHRDGSEYMVEDSAAPICGRNGELVGAVMVFFDVSMMHRVPHVLSYHATHDALTGLINRREFERRLSELMVEARQSGHVHALAYLDLDQFKLVNDSCGHAVGDRLLCQLTWLLKERVRDSDTLARLGGDEFALLLENCTFDRARQISEELRRTVKGFRFVWKEHSFAIGVSIGLVPITPDSVTPAEVLSEADAACFAAKEKGRNRIQAFEPGDRELARRHGEMQWVSRINKALDEDRFRLYCQSIIPLTSGEAAHGEILLRLEEESGRQIPPFAFLPAAERYNQMAAIDRWVIQHALVAIGAYLRTSEQPAALRCNINLSGASLGEEGFADYVLTQLEQHDVPGGALCFEITESEAIANLERAAAFMRRLKERGCRFALDDFGSGLSSFAYLKTLPVDYLKIDGSFVREVVHDEVAREMVRAIHAVGHVMGIKTVAEYVENEQILAVIREIGIDYAQGYGIGYPKPLAECLTTCGRSL